MVNFEPKIIFEDDDILVLDKPAGLTVDRANTNKNTFTVQDWIDKKYNNAPAIAGHLIYDSGDFKSRSGIVHRLDKETSGVLLVAKTKEAFENLQAQFKNRQIVKKYLALVHGGVKPQDGTINVPIERNPFNKKKFGVFPGGRESITEYKTICIYSSFSLLELFPHTGRTHQIRVHLKYINHPIVGDILYSGRKNMVLDKRICPRMFLHAAYLKIKHPKTKEDMEFNAELPEVLQEVLNKLFIK